MGTIPASADVNVIPGVVPAAGNALEMIGLVLDDSGRVPISPLGSVASFPDAASVEAYFGGASKQAIFATSYFAGFIGRTAVPEALLFTNYPTVPEAAFLRGGNVSGLSLTQLQALSGTLTVVVDGYSHAGGTISLSSATSFSAAASVIETALNTSPVQGASVTGSITPETASFTASIAGFIMEVTEVASGTIVIGGTISGTGVTSAHVVEQISGTTGGIGSYYVDVAQTVASESITEAYGQLTVTAVSSGTVSIGQTLSGTNVSAGTVVTALGTGTGQDGTYIVNNSQTVSSETIACDSTNLAVSYDSTSGAFVITSGITGTASTAAFATGTLATSLLLTSTSGAVISQGANTAIPASFMDAVIGQTQNWVSFTTNFDPDVSATNGSSQKVAFAAWNNSVPDRYIYAMWDTDASPTTNSDATSSAGNIVAVQKKYEGTVPLYDPNGSATAAFLMGSIASLDFTATNGRATMKFRTQSGIVATVSDETVASNLDANGYNYVAAVATATQQFVYFRQGSISGIFKWIDSYADQVWLNNQFQQSLMTLLTQLKSIPYNPAGYGQVEQSLTAGATLPIQLPPASPVAAALNFGAIRPNVPLDADQIAEVNAAAGIAIDGILSTRGWYLQILPATASVRAARGTPPCSFWYTDGESIQQITLNSLEVQ